MLQQSSALDVIQLNERRNADSLIDMEKIKNLLSSDKLYLQSEVRNLEAKYDEKARESELNLSKSQAFEMKVSGRTCSAYT